MRREFDSLGDVEVPANRYWGAQTQRSLQHFNIGHDRMPKEVYHAYGYVKKAAAIVNTAAGRLPAWKGQLIERVCDEVISGKLDTEFPLYVFQTAKMTGTAYVTAANVSLFKIANDLRWLGSGPRTGLAELIFPANEPGSSIMPGKVNPTQAEAMLMVAIQVIASDVAVTMGGNEGNFELNAFRPILISNYLHSALIMADMCDHLREFMIEGTKLNQAKLTQNIDNSVMMVTALSPVIGYDKAAAISTTPSTTT